MSCAATTDSCRHSPESGGDITSRQQSPNASLDWDCHLDSRPLQAAGEQIPPLPPEDSRMTTSDVTNGNYGDVTSDDETEQLIGQIEAMTQRTLAETGAVIGFIDDPP